MDITIYPQKLKGTVQAIASKSQAHRLLICAAFSDKTTHIHCQQTNQDIEATADCLCALGADITRQKDGYTVRPITSVQPQATLCCRESGSTLRFMLPVVAALGVDATFILSGRLSKRPLSPLWEELERMGCTLTRPAEDTVRCCGQLQSGIFSIDGSVSSQFITGLLFAAALLPGESQIKITGKLESLPYIRLTQQVLRLFGVDSEEYRVKGCRPFSSPGNIAVEGDWSNAAFFLAAAHMGSAVEVTGLASDSTQGDKACAEILAQMNAGFVCVDAAHIPDLVPILAVAAASAHGAEFHNIARLRLKESDRVASVLDMLKKLGCDAAADENTMRVCPARFHSCVIDSVNDHRIAMAAAIAATVSSGPVTILGGDCVSKSYPSFWDEYRRLGGHYEQYIR